MPVDPEGCLEAHDIQERAEGRLAVPSEEMKAAAVGECWAEGASRVLARTAARAVEVTEAMREVDLEEA